MQNSRVAIVLFAIVFFSFFVSTTSQAVMHNVKFNAFTQAQTGQPNRLTVRVEVFDDQLVHPPDFVKEVRIKAPDGSTFYLDVSKDWFPLDKIFYDTFVAADFAGGVIPSGTYTVRVTPNVGTAISATDSVSAKFMDCAVVTNPTEGLTNVPETPTFTWNSVTGATYYKIILYNKTWGEPVYYWEVCPKVTDFTSYTIPPGDLKPNCRYRVMIEARAGSQDVDMRSRSDWINFETGAW